MQKIPTLWVRDESFRATGEVTPGCEWVLEAESDASIKWDGTAVLIAEGKAWRRHRLKKGKPRPEGWVHWREMDTRWRERGEAAEIPTSGHGWMPAIRSNQADAYLYEAYDHWDETGGDEDGTYELCGPMVKSNPHGFERHILVRHGEQVVMRFPLTFDGMRRYLDHYSHEGVVWHHRDGRMSKVKRRDFGYKWPLPKED